MLNYSLIEYKTDLLVMNHDNLTTYLLLIEKNPEIKTRQIQGF